MQARDIMTVGVIAVSEPTPIEAITRLMKQHRINGVPVIGQHNQVVGVVCQENLFVKEHPIPFSKKKTPTLFDETVDLDRLPQACSKVPRRAAADVAVHELAGVISRVDLVGLMAEADGGQ